MTMPWIRLTLPLAVALLPACTPTPDEVPPVVSESDSGASSSSGPGPTTTPPTMTGEDTVGTQTGTGTDTTMGVVDDSGTSSAGETTMGVGPTTGDGTSSSDGGESSSTGEPMPMCMDDEDCANNQVCTMGDCVDACGGTWGSGTYDPCINDYGAVDVMGLCEADHLCLVDAFPSNASACRAQGCADACDCPAPPISGDATVTCADITSPDDDTDCYLSCGDGETCPNGMMCFAGFVCMTPVDAQLPVYGNCGGLVPDCAAPGFCLNTGNETVCQMDCVDHGDCPPAPPTGNAVVTCGLANASNPDNECYLDCGGGETCPVGMACTNGYICAFPL